MYVNIIFIHQLSDFVREKFLPFPFTVNWRVITNKKIQSLIVHARIERDKTGLINIAKILRVLSLDQTLHNVCVKP